MMKKTNMILLLIGFILLGINILGLFKIMRNPDIYTEELTLRDSVNN